MGVACIKSCHDFHHDPFEIPEHVVIPEAEHLKALSPKVTVTLAVFLLIFIEIVLAAIEFDHKTRRIAGEIHDELIDRHLTTEMKAACLQRTKF